MQNKFSFIFLKFISLFDGFADLQKKMVRSNVQKKKKRKNKLYKTELLKIHYREQNAGEQNDYCGFFKLERKMQILIWLRRKCRIGTTKMCAGRISKLYKHLPKVEHKYSKEISRSCDKAIFPKCLHWNMEVISMNWWAIFHCCKL